MISKWSKNRLNLPSTACGEILAPFLADEVDIDDVDEDEDDDAGRRSDSDVDCRRSSPPPPPFLLPPLPALPYLTASMKGFPTPVTLFAVR